MMVKKRPPSDDTGRLARTDTPARFSPQGIGICIGLILAVAALWALTATPQRNEWYFFERYSNPIFAFNVACSYVALLCAYVLARQELRRERSFRLALHLGTLLVLLVMIELPAAVGLFDYRTLLVLKMVGGPGPHNRTYKAELYWHRPPHDEFVNVLPGDTSLRLGLVDAPTYRASHRYDQNGFRNDHDLDQAEIVLLGDSFVEGYKVTQSEMLSTKLASVLGTNVASLGQAGFGCQSELAVLRDVGVRLKPKVIVWLFFEGNDLYDYDEERRTWTQHAGGWRERSLTINLLKISNRWSLRYVPNNQRELRIPHAIVSSTLTKDSTRIFFDLLPAETVNTAAYLQKCKDFIEQASELSAQIQARFILIYVPTKFSVYKDVVEVVRAVQGDLALTSYAPSLSQWSRAKRIEFHDLTPVLTAGARDGELVYFPDDEHWTPLGHTLAASKTAEIIQTGPAVVP